MISGEDKISGFMQGYVSSAWYIGYTTVFN